MMHKGVARCNRMRISRVLYVPQQVTLRAEAHGSGWCRGLPPNRETDAGTGRNGCPKLDHCLSPPVMQREIIIFLFYFRRDIIRR